MGLLIGAVIVLAVGGLAWWRAQVSQGQHKRLLLTENVDVATLTSLRESAAQAAGEGAFHQLADLTGTAEPGPGGLLTSELSQTECVWYQQKVTRRYKEVYRDSDGNRRTRTEEEEVSSNVSTEPFLLRDATGEITVTPSDGVKQARKVMNKFVEGSERNGAHGGILDLLLASASTGDGDTIGFEYEEWVLAPGARIFVHGEATDRDGRLELVSPEGKDTLLVSTRTEEQLREGHRKNHMYLRYTSLAAFVVGGGLGIAAAVTALV